MKLLFLVSFVLPTHIYGQSLELFNQFKEEPLSVIRQFKEDGDLRASVVLVNHIINTSTDSLLIAETLYEKIEVGHLVGKRMQWRQIVLSGIQDQEERDRHQSLLGEDISFFRREGLDIYTAKYSELNDFTPFNILTDLAQHFPYTGWGERAAMVLVTYGGYGSPSEDPFNLALQFLERYPNTRYRPAMYEVIGYVYSDALMHWDCNFGDPDIDELRKKAIKYYSMALEQNELEGMENLSNPVFLAEARRGLEDKLCPHQFHLFSD